MKATTEKAKAANEDVRSFKELRDLVHRSSMVIAHYWPMTTFVHHNPIRSLEHLPFGEAVKVAQRFVGGRGYLPNEQYRMLLKAGRIGQKKLDAR
ncbi:MAG: DUF2309 domain-containing protein, partial [Cyanobacteria bacterium]|nr:DUF2309 domain-containing protein [Cyanobacteriota bacterium]